MNWTRYLRIFWVRSVTVRFTYCYWIFRDRRIKRKLRRLERKLDRNREDSQDVGLYLGEHRDRSR